MTTITETHSELGTLLAQGLAPVIIAINIGGCTTERMIGPDDAPPRLRDITPRGRCRQLITQ